MEGQREAGGSHSRQLQGAGVRRRTRDEGKAVTEGPNRGNEWRGVPDVGAGPVDHPGFQWVEAGAEELSDWRRPGGEWGTFRFGQVELMTIKFGPVSSLRSGCPVCCMMWTRSASPDADRRDRQVRRKEGASYGAARTSCYSHWSRPGHRARYRARAGAHGR